MIWDFFSGRSFLWNSLPRSAQKLLTLISCHQLCQVHPTQNSGLLTIARPETSLSEGVRVWCELTPAWPPRLWLGTPGKCVLDRQLDHLVDEMEQNTNLPKGAIDHCHNKQPAVAWQGYIFWRSSPGERVFVNMGLLRVWQGLVSVRDDISEAVLH